LSFDRHTPPHPSRASLGSILLFGFGAMLMLMAFSWYVYIRQLEVMHTSSIGTKLASERMEAIANLIDVARTRSRLATQMTLTEDVFERDEINLMLDRKAAEFARARDWLLKSGLDKREQAIMQGIAGFTGPALNIQRRISDMAMMRDDPQLLPKAQKMVTFELLPLQEKIIDHFMELFHLQKSKIEQANRQVESDYAAALKLASVIISGSILLALMIAYFIVRKSTSMERALQNEKDKANITLKSIGDAVIGTDAHGRIEYMNPMAEKLTGFTLAEAAKRPVGKVFLAHDEVHDRPVSEHIQALAQGGLEFPLSSDIQLRNNRDEKYWIDLTLAPIYNQEGIIKGVILTFRDDTSSRHLAKQIEHQARHDALTGLLNRHAFEERVTHALELYEEQGPHVMCAIDLDRFKIVNDTCGHAAGDELLRQLTALLRGSIRRGDFLARMGGDEFSLFLLNTQIGFAAQVAYKILEQIREYRFHWDGKTFRVGASIGLIETPADNQVDYRSLLQAADTACYLAKDEGRDRIKILPYDQSTLDNKRREGEWVQRITDAFDKNSFLLVFQDIVSLTGTHAKVGHREALIRMRDRDGSMIPPMSFLPAAERYNLMTRIDEWVLQQVIDLLRENSGIEGRVAINLSGQSIGDPDCVDRLLAAIESSGVEPARLCFELTETTAIANMETARLFMNRARELGCQIALDDFGSGLSSFAYIKNLPVDIIKIDGQFVRQILEDKTSRVMVEAIHGISQALGLQTIAEFVETEAIALALTEIGIDMGQGYYFGRPQGLMPANQDARTT
jgi:diguanylate cyclase (GGDEF)-like protein/PAS domain S-box-containing protein